MYQLLMNSIKRCLTKFLIQDRLILLEKHLVEKGNVRLNQVGESYSLISKEKEQDHVLHC